MDCPNLPVIDTIGNKTGIYPCTRPPADFAAGMGRAEKIDAS
jgi:hypothetical protein